MSKLTPLLLLRDHSGPYICRSCRQKASQTPHVASTIQKRWLSRNMSMRILEAENDWQQRAAGIISGEKHSFLEMLEARGLVNQVVGDRKDLETLLTGRRVGAYVGIDPTAPSMHVGHMVPYMALAWFYLHGYHSTFLLGGATARVGDPTDRLTARTTMKKSERLSNMTSMHVQLRKLGQNIEACGRKHGYHREWAWRRALENNARWWQKITFLDFIKGPGSVARMGPLLGRDSVKSRMEQSDGMSVAEFTYPLMQAYDWYQLYLTGTQIQIGGSDQFGNILEGANIVKRLSKKPELLSEIPVKGPDGPAKWEKETFGKELSDDPMGFTVPLMTTSSGEKFGKSAGNAIWLDPDMTSSFELYQYFLRLPDNDVERYLKLLTFLPLSEIAKIMQEHQGNESKRLAQHTLAFEFLYLVHGQVAATLAQQQHEQLFQGNISLADLAKPTPPEQRPGEINPSVNKYALPTTANSNFGTRIKLPRSLVEGQHLHKILWSAGMVSSKGEAHKLAQEGGAQVGSSYGKDRGMADTISWTPIKEWTPEDVKTHLLQQDVLVFRVGKWKIKIVEIVSDEEYEELGLSCPGWKEHPLAEKEDWKELATERGKFVVSRKADILEKRREAEEDRVWRLKSTNNLSSRSIMNRPAQVERRKGRSGTTVE